MTAFGKLITFYRDVDASVAELETTHYGKLQCRPGCAACCIDDITVFAIEADYIQSCKREWLQTSEAMPTGLCAFLDAGGRCRIYDCRPYVCRTQGLPLRWIEVSDTGNTEFRDICPVNEPYIDVMELDCKDCFRIGPFEQRLLEMQAAYDPLHPKQRRALRSLFQK